MRKNYSEEQKKEIVSRYRLGEKISNICEDTGISKSTNKYIEFYNSKMNYTIKCNSLIK